MSSLARASLINLGARLLAVALGLGLTLLTARMGPEVQGAFALFLAVEAAVLALGSGLGVLVARRLSHERADARPLLRATVRACLAAGCALGLGLWGCSRLMGGSYAELAWLAVVAPVMLLPGQLSGVWLGQGRMGPLAVLLLAPPGLALAAIGLLQLSPWQGRVEAVLAAWVGARLVVAMGVAWVLRPARWPAALGTGTAAARAGAGELPAASWAVLAPHARFIGVIGVTNVVSLLNYKVDLFLVERHLGLGPTGVYAIAVAVAELLWLVSSAVTTAAYARIGQPDRAAALALTRKAMITSVLLLLILSPLLWGAAGLLVPALLGPAYAGALPVLAVLLPGVALYGGASALSAWFTNHAGRPQVPALLAGFSLVLNIAISLLAIPRWGLMGAALGTTLSYAATMGLAWVMLRRAAHHGPVPAH